MNLSINIIVHNFSVLEHEKVYLDNLPDGEFYERSYMHQDVITHITVTK